VANENAPFDTTLRLSPPLSSKVADAPLLRPDTVPPMVYVAVGAGLLEESSPPQAESNPNAGNSATDRALRKKQVLMQDSGGC
jgi:hypothetical protein